MTRLFIKRSLRWLYKDKKARSKEGRRWQFSEPKTKNSRRKIVMSPMLKKVLEIHKIISPINEFDLLFSHNGGPVDPDTFVKKSFHPTLSLAGLRRIRFHDLRHSHASLLIAQGENVKFIQMQLGHASIQTTLDRYGHLLPNAYVGVGERMDGQIFDSTPEPTVEEKSQICELVY